MTEAGKIDAIAADLHAFGSQPQFLLETRLTGQKNLSFGAEDTVPRQRFRAAQRPYDLTCSAGETTSRGHVAVSRDLAFGDTTHSGLNLLKHADSFHARSFDALSFHDGP
jgi:hypothetical protein